MKIRPDSRRAPWLAAAVFCVVTVACGVPVKASEPVPSEPALTDRARAFVHARADRSAAAGTKSDEAPAGQTVDVTGAVARPGQFLIGPSLDTLNQALDAAGGLTQSAVAVRIHPGDDAAWKLFAKDDAAATAVELPVAALSSPPPIYLRHGDVIDVIAADPPTQAVAAVAEQAAAPSTATAPPPSPGFARASTVVAEAPKPLVESSSHTAETPQPVAELPAVVADVAKVPADSYDVQAELAKLRNEMDVRLGTLRAEIDKLQAENARLAARLERPAGAPPQPAAADATAKNALTKKVISSAVEKPAEVRSMEPAKPAAQPARAATVLVSGSVRNPGVYPVNEVKTVRGAVLAAGGRDDADMGAVELRPEGQRGALVGMGLGMGTQPAKTVVNLVAVDAGRGGDVALRGGEVIFVPPASRSELER